jgi:hypothetical protein
LTRPIATLSIGTSYGTSMFSVRRSHLLETLDSEPVPCDTICNIRSPSITLRKTLVGQKTGQEISACALLNSGAEGIIVNYAFAKKHQLTL